MKLIIKYLALFFLILTVSKSSAQSVLVHGVVVDESNNPLPGVNILLKETNKGTITDIDGRYEISIDAVNHILEYSFIGLKTIEIDVAGRSIVDVTMEKDVMELSEVVVTAIGVESETRSLGYSVSSASGASVKESLQGAVGGVQIRGVSSWPSNEQESYGVIRENGFKKVSRKPLSTFSVDVDAASYSNIRRFINAGSLPPEDAVRIEEMINYFNYDYVQPDNDLPFSINTELATCPWNEDNLLLHVGLQGKEIAMEDLPPSNIVFLLDVSGSMSSANKLPLLKSSLKLLLENLREQDRIAIVVYAGNSGLVLPSTSAKNKQTIASALDRLNAGGSTAGGEGLKLAYKVAAENFMEDGNNRIILATDGDFNVGQSSNEEMEKLIVREREKGIAISVLGYGMGNYKDDKMEIIADKGNGNYAYIDNLQEARKVLVSEFGGTLFTIAKDVKFQLEFNPAHVSSYRLIGYENRLLNEEDFEDDKKDAGEIGAGHTVTALYEIVPAKEKKKHKKRLRYQALELTDEAKRSNDLITLKLRYKKPNGKKSKLIEQPVKNLPQLIDETSDNFRFSAAVASFGMLMRNSAYLGSITWGSAFALAKDSKGEDEDGYRREMVRLMKIAESMKSTQGEE